MSATPPSHSDSDASAGSSANQARLAEAGVSQVPAALQRALGHSFKDPRLLLEALTHRSYAFEHASGGTPPNERLEFLGDAVLQLISSDVLYTSFPDASEGELSSLRAALVRASTLAAFARDLPLGPYLRLGKGEEATGGRDRELLVASAFEAVLGALYLDGGARAARHFVEPRLRAEVARAIAQERIKDDKSRLQELAQGWLGVTPSYRVVEQSGLPHDRTFVVEVLLGDVVAARGQGRSKRQAEQAAAHAALEDEGWRDPA
jgi:ribonuclease III